MVQLVSQLAAGVTNGRLCIKPISNFHTIPSVCAAFGLDHVEVADLREDHNIPISPSNYGFPIGDSEIIRWLHA